LRPSRFLQIVISLYDKMKSRFPVNLPDGRRMRHAQQEVPFYCLVARA
jgi:hypothetical protein